MEEQFSFDFVSSANIFDTVLLQLFAVCQKICIHSSVFCKVAQACISNATVLKQGYLLNKTQRGE